MALDPGKLQKTFKRLHNIIKQFPKQPTPEEVHDLRTRTRRVEAALQALQLDREPEGQQLLKAMAPIRRKAGKVRDMDVLVGFAAKLESRGHEQCLVQLLEHLGHRRHSSTRKLYKAAASEGTKANRLLKRCLRSIRRNVDSRQAQIEWPSDAAGEAMRLAGELARWPKLNRQNLHEFRLQVKQLRYVLQLSGKDDELIAVLAEVKDKIGEWHDWMELAGIAAVVIQHPGPCEARKNIKARADARFDEALGTANRLRRKYLAVPPGDQRRTKRMTKVDSVLNSAAKLAA